MGRTTNCLALIRLPARLRERETPGIATNTTLVPSGLLEMQQAMLRIRSHVCAARGHGSPVLRVGLWHEDTAQHQRSMADRITARRTQHQRLRAACCSYMYAAVSVRFCFASWQELTENHHRTRIYCDDHIRIGCSLTSPRGSSLDLHYFSRHCDVHQLRICTVSTHQNVLMRDGTLIICGTGMYVCMYNNRGRPHYNLR